MPEEVTRIRALSSEPEGLLAVDDFIFFSARDPQHGRELWAVDASTEQAPFLVADIVPGPRSSDPKALFNRNALVYVNAETLEAGRELWVCTYLANHTWATKPLADIQPGPFGSNPMPFANLRGFTLLSAATLDEGRELYIAQGEEAPRMLKDIFPGAPGFADLNASFTVAGDRFFMIGYANGEIGKALLVTDGSTEGTKVVLDVEEEAAKLTTLNKTSVIFENFTHETGWELWISDGTPQGTHILKDIAPGAANGSPKNITAWRGGILFGATLPQTGTELWTTDGTENGTHLLKDLATGPSSSDPYYFTPCGDLVFFSAETPETGRELWVTDGTPDGTHIVMDAIEGPKNGNPYALCAGKDRLVYSLDDGEHGEEPWVVKADGSNPHLLLDIFPGPKNAQPAHTTYIARRNRFYFSAEELTHGRELWMYDVAKEQVRICGDISSESEPDASSSPAQLTPCGAYLYFTANDLIHGTELWRCGVRLDDVELVKDIHEGSPSGSPHDLVAVPPYLYFSADDGVHGEELWRTDGTAEGTLMVGEVVVGPRGGAPRNLCVRKDRLYFSASDPTFGEELYAHTLGDMGVERLTDLAHGPASSSPHFLRAWEGRLYFVANDGEHGDELWVLDSGRLPVLVRNIAPSPVDKISINELVSAAGGAYAATSSPAGGTAVVHVDATETKVLPSVGAEAREPLK